VKGRTAAVILVLAVIVFAGLSFWYLRGTPKPSQVSQGQITVGIPPTDDSSGLVYIAADQGFFADNGLDVTIKDYDVGLRAVSGTLKNENDIAVATEFVIVSKAFEHENVSAVAAVAMYEDKFVIGRTDRGIEGVADLKGKSIGCDRGTISEFFLGRFLQLHDINLTDVTIVDIKRPQFINAS